MAAADFSCCVHILPSSPGSLPACGHILQMPFIWKYKQGRDLKQGVSILKVHKMRMFELSAEDAFHLTMSCCWLRSFPSFRHRAFTSFSCSKWASKTHHLKQRFTSVNAVNIFTCSKEYCDTYLAWFKLSMVNRWIVGLIS